MIATWEGGMEGEAGPDRDMHTLAFHAPQSSPVKSLETWVDGHRYLLIHPWASAVIDKWAISWPLN